MNKITLSLPDSLYELLDKANLLNSENSLMFYTAGIMHYLCTSPTLTTQVRESGVNMHDLFKLTGVASMEAAEKALIIKNTDA
jgi:hypothetical protein